MREENLDDAVSKALHPLRLDAEEIEYAGLWVRNARLDEGTLHEREIRNCRLLLDQNRARLIRLTDAFLDGSIDRDLFDQRKAGLLVEERDLKEKIDNLEQKNGNVLVQLENFLELAKTASTLYKTALPDEKRDLLKKLTSNLTAMGKNVDVGLTIPARLIANRQKNTCSAPQRGTTRTGVRLELEGVLEELFKFFASQTEIGPVS